MILTFEQCQFVECTLLFSIDAVLGNIVAVAFNSLYLRTSPRCDVKGTYNRQFCSKSKMLHFVLSSVIHCSCKQIVIQEWSHPVLSLSHSGVSIPAKIHFSTRFTARKLCLLADIVECISIALNPIVLPSCRPSSRLLFVLTRVKGIQYKFARASNLGIREVKFYSFSQSSDCNRCCLFKQSISR